VFAAALFFVFAGICCGQSANDAKPLGQVGGAPQPVLSGSGSYVELPVEELTRRVGALKGLEQAPDNPEFLAEILRKTGRSEDAFFDSFVDLSAKEKITQQRVRGKMVTASEHVEDSYLILRQGTQPGANVREFRTDSKGNQLPPVGLEKGFLITFGFALMSNYFSTDLQHESNFRYLGEQKIDAQETYVVAFAQKPGEATVFVSFADRKGTAANLLMQGIAWIDKSNFQIIRMRTDLLAPPPGIDLERQSTEVTFDKVQLADVANAMWLPKEVKVELKFRQSDPGSPRLGELVYRNEHHYSGYERYRVSVKMVR
jgi:hypothetical protein